MTRKKVIFLIVAVIFFVAIIVVSFDISRRTTFPGSKPQLRERIKKEYLPDTTINNADSLTID